MCNLCQTGVRVLGTCVFERVFVADLTDSYEHFSSKS